MSIPTVKDRLEILRRGAEILAPVLVPHGFHFTIVSSGEGSGGAFACGDFAHADRRLELHLRGSLGLVTYHVGSLSLAHDDYLRALVGRSRAGHYPGFSNDPIAGFEALRQDLVEHCSDFVRGSGEPFRQCVARHRHYVTLSPLQKMEYDSSQPSATSKPAGAFRLPL